MGRSTSCYSAALLHTYLIFFQSTAEPALKNGLVFVLVHLSNCVQVLVFFLDIHRKLSHCLQVEVEVCVVSSAQGVYTVYSVMQTACLIKDAPRS